MNSLASRSVFKRHLKLAVLSTALVCGTLSASHAGFEWIPAPDVKVQSAPKAQMPAPAVPAPRVLEAPVPQDTELSAPVPAPAPIQAPVVKSTDMLPVPSAAEDTQPVIKVKNFYAEEPTEEPQALSEPVPIATLSAADGDAAPVEAPKQPEEIVVKRNVIIPDNAPESAIVKISNDGAVVKPAPEKIEEKIIEAVVKIEEPASVDEPIVQDVVVEERQPSAVTPDEILEFAGSPVVGFGTDMPLALALNQIVPSNYAYAFGDGVNPGYRVSWSGGKSWVDVVSDMVKPLHLTSEVRGKTVYIRADEKEAAFVPAKKPVVDIVAVEEPLPLVDDGSLSPVPDLVYFEENDQDKARKNVTDPGEDALIQPVETVDALENTVRDAADINVSEVDAVVWEARKGDSLKDTLVGWSKVSGVELVWDADYDYRLSSDVSTSGAFENALKNVVGGAIEGDSVPSVRLVDILSGAPQKQAKLIIQDQPKG
jgi:hypothetical protein